MSRPVETQNHVGSKRARIRIALNSMLSAFVAYLREVDHGLSAMYTKPPAPNSE